MLMTAWIRARHTRRIVSLVLSLLLAAIQQAGLAHALTHLANPSPQNSSRNDTPHPAAKVCTECIAFAQIDSALLPASALPAVIVAPAAPVAAEFRPFEPEFVAHFRSRAPPLFA